MRILHLDIETAPNLAHVWGLFKQNVGINQIMESSYTLCLAAKWHDEGDVFFSSVYEDDPKVMIECAWTLLDRADVVVHYNGKKFDIPTLNKEFLLQGLTPPSPYKQVDLLSVARSQFRFPSNKLDYVAQRLGIGKKVKHVGHELWVACMNNDPLAWKEMEKYNKQDVVLLEELYKKLLPWISGHPNHALYVNSEDRVCPKCGKKNIVKKGTETIKTAMSTYQRYKCKDCGANIRGRTNLFDRDNLLVGV